jgi:hypothetical protein
MTLALRLYGGVEATGHNRESHGLLLGRFIARGEVESEHPARYQNEPKIE